MPATPGVAPTRRELFAFGLDLVKKLRGREDQAEMGVIIGPMETTRERCIRLGERYTIGLSSLGSPTKYIAITVVHSTIHSTGQAVSNLEYNAYVLPEDFERKLSEIAADVLKRNSELQAHLRDMTW